MVEGVHNTVNRGTVLHTQYDSPWKGVEDTRYRGNYKVRFYQTSK
jgi:hypothetical protein